MMGTRFYLPSSGTPPVSPAYSSEWEYTTAAVRRMMRTAKQGTAFAETTIAAGATFGDILGVQYISEPMQAGIAFLTAHTAKGVIRCRSEDMTHSAYARIVIKVVSQDGTTLRATLVAMETAHDSNFATVLENRKFPDAWVAPGKALGVNYTTLEGDRLVFEVGYHRVVGGGAYAEFGDSSPYDLAENETGEIQYCPWIELSTTFTFVTPNAPVGLAPTGKVLVQKPTYAGDYSQGLGQAMAAVQVRVYASNGTTLIWDSGEVAATGARWVMLHGGGANLSLGATYKWQARNKDAIGMWGPYCDLQSMNINAAPTTPSGCSPTGGETVTTVTPTLLWAHNDPDSDAQKFARYEIRDNDTGLLVAGYPETNTKAVDTFTRANSATVLGNDETAPTPLAWAVAGAGTPTWGIIGKEAYCVNGAAASMAYLNPAVADGEVRCRVKREGAYEVGIVFRSDGTLNNCFRLHFVAAAVQGIRVRLTQVLASATSTVFTSPDLDIADGGYADFRVVLSGTSYTVYVNGVSLYTGTIDNALKTNTRHGLYYPAASSPSLARWDDFAVYTTAAAAQQHVVPGSLLAVNHTYAWKVKTSDGCVPGLWGAETAGQLFHCAVAPTCTITHPAADGEIEPAPSFYVVWSYSDGGASLQSKRRMVVYNEDLSELVYDSGEHSGAGWYLPIPAGYLHNGLTYKAKVYVWNSLATPVMGESAWRSFYTQWIPPAAITGVAAQGVS